MLKNKKGFTLIELMVVIVIIGILASLAIPRFTEAAKKARAAEAPRVLASYESAQLARVAEAGVPGNVSELIFQDQAATTWYNYSHADGTYAYQADGRKDLAGVILNTTYDDGNMVRGGAKYDKLLPNWN